MFAVAFDLVVADTAKNHPTDWNALSGRKGLLTAPPPPVGPAIPHHRRNPARFRLNPPTPPAR